MEIINNDNINMRYPLLHLKIKHEVEKLINKYPESCHPLIKDILKDVLLNLMITKEKTKSDA